MMKQVKIMIEFTEEEKQELRYRIVSMVSRKFLISLLILVVSTYMVFTGNLTGESWLLVAAGDILGYQFSNALSKGRSERREDNEDS